MVSAVSSFNVSLSRPPLSSSLVTRWRLILLLAGWLVATGAHWDLIQVAAWGRMWVQNLRSESPVAALATTFSPEGMCRVCQAVQAAKLRQQNDPSVVGPVREKAPLLPLDTRQITLVAPVGGSFFRLTAVIEPPAQFTEPPVPPPRAAPL